jgi:ribosomal subunit interface protein
MVNIKATQIELTDDLRDLIEKRVASTEKFTKHLDRVYVDVGRTTNHHKQGEVFRAEFNVVINGEKFNAFMDADDINTAVDEAHRELVRQITERKDHKISLFRRGARSVKKMLKGISKRNPMTSKVEE